MTSVGTKNESTRVAWLERTLKELPNGWRILDAGAGQQQYRKFCGHLEYVSQDFGQYKPDQEKAGLHRGKWDYGKLDIVCDIASIPEPDGSFDAILCAEVFEHLPDPIAAVREFSRLLRPEGVLILTAPFCSLTHFAPYHYSTGFGKYWYEKHLPDHGLEVIELAPNGNYFEYLAQELRRVHSIAGRYAGSHLRRWEKLASRLLLRCLERFSHGDTGSDELLCFGYHVRARRL